MAYNYFDIDKDGQIIRLKQNCPRCGDGVYLAEMFDRRVCGKCSYTSFKEKPGKVKLKEVIPPKVKKGKKRDIPRKKIKGKSRHKKLR